jgi:hypothetical protein
MTKIAKTLNAALLALACATIAAPAAASDGLAARAANAVGAAIAAQGDAALAEIKREMKDTLLEKVRPLLPAPAPPAPAPAPARR